MLNVLFSPLGFFFLAVLACLFIGALIWYRKKELHELRAVEFQIIALELDRKYSKISKSLAHYLQPLGLFPGHNGQIFNLFAKQHSNFNSYIFDSIFTVGNGKSKKKVTALGVAVDLTDVEIPLFRIKPARPFDSFTLFSNMKKVKRDKTPHWLINRYSVFRHRSVSDAAIQSIFENNDHMHKLLMGSNVYMLTGNHQTVVLFREGALPVSLPYFTQLEEVVDTLAQAFDEEALPEAYIPDPDVDEEIKVLKQNARGTS